MKLIHVCVCMYVHLFVANEQGKSAIGIISHTQLSTNAQRLFVLFHAFYGAHTMNNYQFIIEV